MYESHILEMRMAWTEYLLNVTHITPHLQVSSMTKLDETSVSNMSKISSKDRVDNEIMKLLSSGPLKAGDLESKVTASAKVSRSKYYARLNLLRSDGEVAFVQSGSRRIYGLPKDSRLSQYQKGGNLQRRVIDSARYLADYMMKDARYDTDTKYLSANVNMKFDYFLDMVEILRRIDPGVPEFKCAELEKPEHMRDDATVVRAAYRYLLRVLEYFKAL